jgi:N-acetylglucosaminyldiphosphoundecaprenol N-acetyl-beta-D-mannosaminyltransferase
MTVIVGGIPTSTLGRQDFTQLILAECTAPGQERPLLLFDINGQGIAMAARSPEYRGHLLSADIIHADGQPIVIASRVLTDKPIVERSATTDLFVDVIAASVGTGIGHFLLGGTEQTSADCAAKLETRFPGLALSGRRNGFFSREEEDAVIAEINASGAEIVWVGMGKPREQAFCVRNRDRIKARWLITCGGCFNFVTGSYRRAPGWMQAAGLEWLHRMILNPRRLAMRYLVTNPIAVYHLLTHTRG